MAKGNGHGEIEKTDLPIKELLEVLVEAVQQISDQQEMILERLNNLDVSGSGFRIDREDYDDDED